MTTFTTRLATYTLALTLSACGGGATAPVGHSGAQSGQTHASARVQVQASDYRPLLQQLYVGYFGRPGDPAGIDFYSQRYLEARAPTDIHGLFDAYQGNAAVKALVDSFGTSDESMQLYPGDNRTFIGAIYRNLFSRAADQAGLDYWAKLIDQGSVTRPIAVVAIMAGAAGSDVTIINNKTGVADGFTAALTTPLAAAAYDGMAANASVRAMLASVSLQTDPGQFGATRDATLAQLMASVSKPGAYLLAGSAGGDGTLDGTASNARLGIATLVSNGVASDSQGNVFVADSQHHLIRKVTPAGVVSTLAGAVVGPGRVDGPGLAARFYHPSALAVDASDNLYVGDRGGIRKITPDGRVSTIAGGNSSGQIDGPLASALFGYVTGIAIDREGNIILSQRDDNKIRKISKAGMVSTIAGGLPGNLDGLGKAARLSQPEGVAVDRDGNIFVCDTGNHTIRRISPDGMVSTIAGASAGFADGNGTAARFNAPRGVAIDASGALLITDQKNRAIRKISNAAGSAPSVTTLARQTGTVQIDGSVAAAGFSAPMGIAIDPAGAIYVGDSATLRRIDPLGTVSTVAGLAIATGSADGSGSAARFGQLNLGGAITSDPQGNLYVADFSNHVIRKVTPAGVTSTIAGHAGQAGSTDGTLAQATFNRPRSIARDAVGNLYVADSGNYTIRKIAIDGKVSTLAGMAGQAGKITGNGAQARFQNLQGLFIMPSGNFLIIDGWADANAFDVLKLTPGGSVDLGVFGIDGYAESLAITPDGGIYFADAFNNRITSINGGGTPFAGTGVDGHVDGSVAQAQFSQPTAICADADGNLYVMDGDATLRKITPAGMVTTIAGLSGKIGVADGANQPGTLPVAWAMRMLGPKQFALSTNSGIVKLVLP